MKPTTTHTRLHIFLLLSVTAVFIWSLVGCFDLLTWFLEALPVIVGVTILVSVYRKFHLTGLVLILIWIHAIILLIGAHYTYARMPLFNWIRDVFELSRNHYDRFGHFAQGFVPAVIARELLLRKTALQPGRWLVFIVICICLAISASYELLEWLASVIIADNAAYFLAAQGDLWDSHKDMALCLAGTVISLAALSRLHDRALKNLARCHCEESAAG